MLRRIGTLIGSGAATGEAGPGGFSNVLLLSGSTGTLRLVDDSSHLKLVG